MPTLSNRILILSDNHSLIESLSADMELLGYAAGSETQAEPDIDGILRLSPAVMLFDFTLCNEGVMQAYQRVKNNIRLENLGASLLVLTSEENLAKVPASFKFNDLVLVPYNLRELGFRIKRLMWQKDLVSDQEIIKVEDLVIYLARYEVWLKDTPLELTFKEYELLKYLVTHRGRAFNRESLLNVIWGYDYYGGTRTVDVHIRRIRVKLGDTDEAYIKTVRGVGYMFRG